MLAPVQTYSVAWCQCGVAEIVSRCVERFFCMHFVNGDAVEIEGKVLVVRARSEGQAIRYVRNGYPVRVVVPSGL